jgi:hypothetical protein
MYESQQGILSKAEVNTTPKGSKAGEFIKKHKVAGAIIGGTILGATEGKNILNMAGSILP